MTAKKRVLLVVYNAAHFRELLRLARLMLGSQTLAPLLLFLSSYPTLQEHYQLATSLGITAWVRGQPLAICRHLSQRDIDRVFHVRGQPLAVRRRNLLTVLLALPTVLLNTIPIRRILRQIVHLFLPNIMASLARRLCKWFSNFRALRHVCIAEWKIRFFERVRALELFWIHFIRAWRQLRYARSVCKALRPDLIILAEDNVEYMSGVWSRAAHDLGIRVAIVPYCLAGLEEPAAVYVDDPKHQAQDSRNRRLAKDYPKWVYEYQGRQLVRLPASQALPLEWLGISSPLPWLMNGSYADVIAVESRFMRDFYYRQGIPATQLVITGTASDDVMYDALINRRAYRNQLYAQYGMLPDRPMILCALPPQTSAMAGLREEFSSYYDMLQFWLDALKEIDRYNIFISLHPTMNREEFSFLDEGGWWGMAVAPPDTAKMIALCDIYIASVSSTIRWAIACGKPVINYDVYRFGFPDFRPARGVVTVETKDDFLRVLRRLTADPEYYNSLQQAQEESRAYWGLIDGQSNARLLKLMHDLLDAQRANAKRSLFRRSLEYFRLRHLKREAA